MLTGEKKFVVKLRLFFLDLPQNLKIILAISVDCFLCFFTTLISFYLLIGEVTINKPIYISSLLSIILAIPIFYFSGLYRTIFRYSGWPAMLTVSKSIFIYALVFSFLTNFFSLNDIPRTIGIIQPLLLFFLLGGSRSLIRFCIGDLYKKKLNRPNLPKAIIYGAGDAGRQLLLALENNNEWQIDCFLDDDVEKQGRVLSGKKIYSPDYLDVLANKKNISYILLAFPGISRFRRKEIIEKLSKYNISLRTLPSLNDIVKGKKDLTDLVELEIDDLLGREVVAPDKDLMKKNIQNKIVLVTGAGGSIGSQLCREIININPKKLLLLDSNEFALYSIVNELDSMNNNNDFQIIPLLASVQDKKYIDNIMNTWRPETVYHAAAYKHVPIVEHNLAAGVKNNVFGTLVVALASLEKKVSDFVFISTDKAVRPTNAMGATKRLSEICLQAIFANKKNYQNTKFSMVRFGNVLNSSGSVIPKFRKQINERSHLTVTHPEINRYFMTIKEAAQLVIQAGSMAKGGDVFILEMGEPVKIYDLAKKMIQLSGLKLKDINNPDGDIEIKFTGLRSGEKLYEELLIEDNSIPTNHPKIFKAQEEFIPWIELEIEIKKLEECILKNDLEEIFNILMNLVKGYKPPKKIVDYMFNAKSKNNNYQK